MIHTVTPGWMTQCILVVGNYEEENRRARKSHRLMLSWRVGSGTKGLQVPQRLILEPVPAIPPVYLEIFVIIIEIWSNARVMAFWYFLLIQNIWTL